MNYISKIIAATVLTGVFALAGHGELQAAEASSLMTLKPMTGPGVGGSQQFLLNYKVGTKQTVSYFQNENGACKLTVMVAEAFNGVDVPNSTTVRFEVAIDAGRTARMDTAEGKSLEFACQGRAEEMRVKTGDRGHGYPPGT
jgi:hypothetical protein